MYIVSSVCKCSFCSGFAFGGTDLASAKLEKLCNNPQAGWYTTTTGLYYFFIFRILSSITGFWPTLLAAGLYYWLLLAYTTGFFLEYWLSTGLLAYTTGLYY